MKKVANKAATKAVAQAAKTRNFADNQRITLLVKENPKQGNTNAHRMYACYKSGMTVGDYLKACAKFTKHGRLSLRWDSEQGHRGGPYISIK